MMITTMTMAMTSTKATTTTTIIVVFLLSDLVPLVAGPFPEKVMKVKQVQKVI